MRRFCFIAAVAFALSVSGSAHACMMSEKIQLDDIKYADVILVGRISKYEIVPNEEFRQRMLANPKLSPEMREHYKAGNGIPSDYARLDLQVEEVLAGEPRIGSLPNSLSVTWYNSTFAHPKTMTAGPFLIALRDASSPIPPLRGPSATIKSNREPGSLTILQAPCSDPFMFESSGREARAIRKILRKRRG